MSAENSSADSVEPPRKKVHLNDDNCSSQCQDTPISADAQCLEKSLQTTDEPVESKAPVLASDFSKLEVVRILSNMDSNCSVAVEAKHREAEGRVLIHMQKTPFNAEVINQIISGSTELTQLFHNDVYSKHTATLPTHLNKVQATIIHPASDKHFARFERELCSFVDETPALYDSLTRPFIESGATHSKQWIYNILEGTSEADRVVCRDDDLLSGFVLVPDIKWTGLQMTDLYCQALVMRRDLSSIRDLRGDCLPLLRNVKEKGTAAIVSRYGVSPDRLRVYLHYLPSFYHLHVHFAALTFDAPGTWCGKAHLLTDVISNLERDPRHYERATLGVIIKDNHPHPLARHNRPGKSSGGDNDGNSENSDVTGNGDNRIDRNDNVNSSSTSTSGPDMVDGRSNSVATDVVCIDGEDSIRAASPTVCSSLKTKNDKERTNIEIKALGM